MMVPMSIRCLTCGEFIYKGKKFNARKETVQNEEYLGIKIFRFYIKCTRCSSEITIKTDPKNSDYQCEMGATRNFEGWKEGEKKMEEFRKQREEEEQGNAMKALENKTMDNKMEMDILDGLDEIRSLNARASKVDPMDILCHLQELQKKEEADYADDEEARTLMELKQSKETIKRLDSDGLGNLNLKFPEDTSQPLPIASQKFGKMTPQILVSATDKDSKVISICFPKFHDRICGAGRRRSRKSAHYHRGHLRPAGACP
jgi:hypothetical protein